jgi:hypothetical protein
VARVAGARNIFFAYRLCPERGEISPLTRYLSETTIGALLFIFGFCSEMLGKDRALNKQLHTKSVVL